MSSLYTSTSVKIVAIFATLVALGSITTDFFTDNCGDSALCFWTVGPTVLLAVSGILTYFASSTILLSVILILSFFGTPFEGLWAILDVLDYQLHPSAVSAIGNVNIVFEFLATIGGVAVFVCALAGLQFFTLFEPIVEFLLTIPTPVETKIFSTFAIISSIGLFVTDRSAVGSWWIVSVGIFLSGVLGFFATSKVLTSATIVLAVLGLGFTIWQVTQDAHSASSCALVWQGLGIASSATVFLVEMLTVGFFGLFAPVLDAITTLLSGILDVPTPLYVKTLSLFAAGAAIGLFVSDIVTVNYTDYFWTTSIPLFLAGVFSYFATSKGLLYSTIVLSAAGVGTTTWELFATNAERSTTGGTGLDALVWESLAIAGGVAVFVSALWIIVFRKSSSSSYVTLPTYGSHL